VFQPMSHPYVVGIELRQVVPLLLRQGLGSTGHRLSRLLVDGWHVPRQEPVPLLPRSRYGTQLRDLGGEVSAERYVLLS
jgi:hypothetical protein